MSMYIRQNINTECETMQTGHIYKTVQHQNIWSNEYENSNLSNLNKHWLKVQQ